VEYDLVRPEHLGDDLWASIESHRRRLADAASLADRPAVVGAAKDLIECVARCVLDATETPLGDEAKFPKLIFQAQSALKRAAGGSISSNENVRAISNAAQAIATGVNANRNDVGTGHGRARTPAIDDEMAGVVSDATMLWCRWALRRLGHLLARYPNHLLAAVNTGTSQGKLQAHFDQVLLPQQPADIQRAIGVAFGRQAAGGFGNAFVVGVKPAIADPDLDRFPVDYRLGLAEGMVIDQAGQIGLIDSYASDLIDVLLPVPSSVGVPVIVDLASKARTASWITRWRGNAIDAMKTVGALQGEQRRLSAKMQNAMNELRAALDPANRE
jgi:hypothetical protein